MENNNGYEYSWDSVIENDSPEFILLPDGDYDFTVERFERGRYEGGDKLPACPKATLYLKISGQEGDVTIRKDLFLHSKCEGVLCAFFTCIGQRKHGQRVSMNWNAVPGSRGRAKVGSRVYNGNKYNEIKRFLEPAEQSYAVPAQAQQYPAGGYAQPQQQLVGYSQPQYQQQTVQGGYTPGKF